MSFLTLNIDASGQKQKQRPDVPQDLPPPQEVKARLPEERQKQKSEVSQDLPLSLEAKMQKPEP